MDRFSNYCDQCDAYLINEVCYNCIFVILANDKLQKALNKWYKQVFNDLYNNQDNN